MMPKHDDANPSFGSKSFYIVYLKVSLTILPTKIRNIFKKQEKTKDNQRIRKLNLSKSHYMKPDGR